MSNLNDSKGKLNEILLSVHLSANGGAFPDHFRDFDMSPRIIHDKLRIEIGDDEYNRVFTYTHEMASEIKGVLMFDQLMANTIDVACVTWTSNGDTELTPGDHEKLTGIKDVNSDADLIVQTISGNYVGISAKYGVSKNITLRGPGAATLEAITGAQDLHSHWLEHIRFCQEELGFEGTQASMHEHFKTCKSSSNSALKNVAKKAVDSSLKARHRIMESIHTALMTKSSDDLKQLIFDLASPTTYYPHYRTQTRPTKTGAQHHVHRIKEHTLKCLANYFKFDVNEEFKAATTLAIYGYRESDGTRERVATISVKGRSGPVKGWNGNVTAPLLSKEF